MAVKKSTKGDQYAQWMQVTLQEPAANTGIVEAFPTSITTREKVGVKILAAHLYHNHTNLFSGTGDGLAFGLLQLYKDGNAPYTMVSPVGIIGLRTIYSNDRGVAATSIFTESPIDLNLRAPVLCHPASLYASILGISQVNPITAYMRIYFEYVDLTDEEYQEILQTVIIQNAL